MMSRRWSLTALTATLLMLVVLPACSLLQFLEDAPRPEITFDDASFSKLSWNSADMVVNFKLKNPYPVAIQLDGYEWDMKVAGQPFLGGNQASKVSVNASNSSVIPVPFTLKFADLLARIKEAKGQEDVPYEFGGKVGIMTPVGLVHLPLKASGKLPVLNTPKVRLKKITAKLEGMTKLIVDIGLGVEHGNGYKLNLAELKYNLKLGGYKVADGTSKPKQTVPNTGETTVGLPIEIDLLSASAALVQIIMSGKFNYDLSTNLGLDTPFGRAPLAFADNGTIKLY